MADFYFSVVITTYNRPDLCLRALQSVMAQSFQDFEVIVVNDASPDSYHEVQDYTQAQQHIQYVNHGVNKGVSAARNTGVAQASGAYVCFLDDDDYYHQNHLASLRQAITEHRELPAIYHTLAYSYKGGELSKRVLPDNNYQSVQEYYIVEGAMLVCCTCMPLSAARQYPFPEGMKFAEDHYQRLLVMHSHPVQVITEYTCVYDQSNDSATSDSDKAVIYGYIQSWRRIFSDTKVRSFVRRKIRNRMLSQYYMLLINYHRSEFGLVRNLRYLLMILMLDFSWKNLLFCLNSSRWILQGR